MPRQETDEFKNENFVESGLIHKNNELKSRKINFRVYLVNYSRNHQHKGLI